MLSLLGFLTVFAAGVFSGVLTGTKMIDAMALSMVSMIPTAHAGYLPGLVGGAIFASGERGAGATFTMFLPGSKINLHFVDESHSNLHSYKIINCRYSNCMNTIIQMQDYISSQLLFYGQLYDAAILRMVLSSRWQSMEPLCSPGPAAQIAWI